MIETRYVLGALALASIVGIALTAPSSRSTLPYAQLPDFTQDGALPVTPATPASLHHTTAGRKTAPETSQRIAVAASTQAMTDQMRRPRTVHARVSATTGTQGSLPSSVRQTVTPTKPHVPRTNLRVPVISLSVRSLSVARTRRMRTTAKDGIDHRGRRAAQN